VQLSDLSLKTDENASNWLSLRFNRTGNMSVYGDLEVHHVSPKGKTTQVANVKGIAVYTPNTTRTFLMALAKDAASNYQEGKLLVTYKTQNGNKAITLAESVLRLGSHN
jgi:hypothetical protein